MSRSTAPLFAPFALGKLSLPNRIVMAPMTRSFSPGGVPGEDVVAYYRRRAENDVGLIVTEGTVIDHPAAASDPRVPRFHGADALSGWSRVVAAVHEVGGRIMPQIWHVGTMRKAGSLPNVEAPPAGPSGLFKPGKKVGEPMTEAEVAYLVDAYGRAAGEAMRLGFDGVEIHGAHGYLIDQFFWDGTNVRDDAFGGDLVARTRFAADIVRACRRATAPGFPILLRFSQWKQQDYTARLAPTPDLLMKFLAPLADAGVDIFHCSTRRFHEPEFGGSTLNLAGWTKKLTGKPVITVGSVGLDGDFFGFNKGQRTGATSIDALIEMVERKEVDLVAVGRALITNPDWVPRVRAGDLAALRGYASEDLTTLA